MIRVSVRLRALLAAHACAALLASCDRGPVAPADEVRAPTAQVASSIADLTGPQPDTGLRMLDPPNPDQWWDIDLGRLPLGELAHHTLRLQNQEARALTIHDIAPGCTCMSAEIAYVDGRGERVAGEMHGDGDVIVLPPGAVAELALTVDSRAVSKDKVNTTKRVRIVAKTDSPTRPYLAFEVHFVVDQPFSPVPLSLRLGNLAASQGGSGELKILSSNDRNEVLDGDVVAPAGMRATVTLDTDSIVQRWTLRVVVEPPVALGPFERELALGVQSPAGPVRPFQIAVSGSGVPDVAVEPTRFAFSSRAPGSVAEVQVDANLAGARLRVLGVRIDARGSELRREVEPIQPDGLGRSAHWKVRLVAPAGLPEGSFAGEAWIQTDDPTASEIAVPYFCSARP